MPISHSTDRQRISEIDFYRFLAALSVIFFHYAFRGAAADNKTIFSYAEYMPFAKYGYLGVELFFMISGFVILLTASRVSVIEFIRSRAIRLYPAFWVCSTITFIFTLLLGGERFSATIGQYLTGLTLLGDFLGVRPIDGVYWSIFVEIRFYLLICVLLVFRQMHRVEGFLLGWLLLSVVLFNRHDDMLRRVFIPDYAAFFIAGAVFWQVRQFGFSMLRLGLLFGSYAFSLYTSLSVLGKYSAHYSVEFNGVVVALVLTTFYLLMALTAINKMGFIARRNWIALGLLTYPLYLLHQNVGYMIFNALYPMGSPHALFWGVVILMLCSSYAISRYLEKPLALLLRNIGKQKPAAARNS